MYVCCTCTPTYGVCERTRCGAKVFINLCDMPSSYHRPSPKAKPWKLLVLSVWPSSSSLERVLQIKRCLEVQLFLHCITFRRNKFTWQLSAYICTSMPNNPRIHITCTHHSYIGNIVQILTQHIFTTKMVLIVLLIITLMWCGGGQPPRLCPLLVVPLPIQVNITIDVKFSKSCLQPTEKKKQNRKQRLTERIRQ